MADDFAKRFPPSITAAKLYEKTSAKGNSYLTGRLGGMRVAIIKTPDTSDDGSPIWELRFSQAPASSNPKPTSAEQPSDHPSKSASGGFGSQAPDDQIPF